MKVIWRLNVGHSSVFHYPALPPIGANINVKYDPRVHPQVIQRDNWATVTVTRGKARWIAWILFWLQARPPKGMNDGNQKD